MSYVLGRQVIYSHLGPAHEFAYDGLPALLESIEDQRQRTGAVAQIE
jgi:hypothetical protein